MFEDKDIIEINQFNGIWSRDSFYDSVPKDHAIDSLNMISIGDELSTRYGFSELAITLANIRRFEIYQREGEADRVLVLNSSGQLFDATASLVTPILTIGSMTDFSIFQKYNNCFITPHNGVKGLSGEKVYIYNGTGVARAAAGSAPSSGFNAVVSASSGNIEAGLHIFAVAYETSSGFVTAPGPPIFPTLNFDGTKSVDFSNIPVGPTGTAKRRILASRAIPDYNGNQEGYEMFFVPGGEIDDNTTTVLAGVDFFDADLQISADYLFDQLSEIPAGCFISGYKEMMIVGGSNANPSLAYVSKPTEPESFNDAAGFITCDPSQTEGLKNAIEYRGALYLFKHNPGNTYVALDNGYEASTWSSDGVDGGIGGSVHGVSKYSNNKKANSDKFLVCDIGGLYDFSGAYNQFPLTYKILNFWNRINEAAFDKVQLLLDSINQLIYVLVPLDSATSPSHIFVGDYSSGMDADNLKWWIWNFTSLVPIGLSLRINATTKKTYLSVGNYAGNIYNQVADTYNDNGVVYNNYWRSASLFKYTNSIHNFAGIGLRIIGNVAVVGATAYGMDDVNSYSLPNITTALSPGYEPQVPMLLADSKCSIKLNLNTINKYFKIRALRLYCNLLFITRPFNG